MTLLLALLACNQDTSIPLRFDGPIAAAVLQAGESSPFTNPIGVVADRYDGLMYPLDLKTGRFLTDDPTASFLRTYALATGVERQLEAVAVTGQGGASPEVVAWAIDSRAMSLLRVPYVTGRDGAGDLVEAVPEAGEPQFLDVDGSGDDATLTDIEVRAGATATEVWSISYDGSAWWARGSASGLQSTPITPGEVWRSDEKELSFVLSGSATAGDRIELTTDAGGLEIPLGGRPGDVLALSNAEIAVGVQGEAPWVGFWDTTGALLRQVPLSLGATPGRMAAASDGRIFIADRGLPVVWIVSGEEVTGLPTAAPVVDLAWVEGSGADGAPFAHLFVAPVGLQRVDVYDAVAGAWVDVNPLTEEVGGVPLGGPVSGLAASAAPVTLMFETPWEAKPVIPTVVATLADGYAVQLEGDSGCVAKTAAGPDAYDLDEYNEEIGIYLEDTNNTSTVTMVAEEATKSFIVFSPCGGVTHTESWSVIFDASTQSWAVEGSLSGPQVRRAREGQRYTSDTGAISFYLEPGVLPADEGDRFTFYTRSGMQIYAGSNEDSDATVEALWENPGRPVSFYTDNGPTGGGWDPVDRRVYALLPIQGSDLVARLHLDSGETNVTWR